MLVPLFYIAEHYLGEDFSREMGPLVTMLFTINDRGIRGSLLKKVPLLVKHLNNNSLNVNVFEPLCSGFSDSSAALRELTLKATSFLVPHLTQPNLEKLSRYFVRLQSDAEDKIRQQTVELFAKLAPHLTEVSREKLLLPALTRGMKDATSQTRLASLQGVLSVKQYFKPSGVASQVIPAVSPCMVDASSAVRKEAFSIMEDLLFVLRQESERLSRLPEPVEHGRALSSAIAVAPPAPAVPVPPPVQPAPAPASGGYFSSWYSSSSAPQAPSMTTDVSHVSSAPPVSAPVIPPSNGVSSMSLGNNADDGWGNDSSGWGEEDDDPFANNDLAMKNIAPKPIPAAARGKLKIPGAKTAGVPIKAAVQKLSVEDSLDDGWDDF
jgi:SCY1-like protein 1